MVKALVVVAHPDDEVIWIGGYILRHPDWDWTIVALCRQQDKDREPRFRKVCRLLGAESYIFDLDDTEEGYFKKIKHDDIENKIRSINNNKFDFIFTHGSNGEYEHIRHRQVSKAATKMVEDGKLKCRLLYHFSYKRKGEYCVANEKADKYIKLIDRELEGKKKLIRNVYGFKDGSFEEISAAGLEAFDMIKK